MVALAAVDAATVVTVDVVEDEFTIGNGSLTPTLKVKRKVVQDRFKDVIDELYADDAHHG